MKLNIFLASENLKPDTAMKELMPISSPKSSGQDTKHILQLNKIFWGSGTENFINEVQHNFKTRRT